MSYLNPLRLHFAGRFQASISTVNNNPTHYDTANFKPEFQVPGPQGDGLFNPRGDANWRLIGCQVTSAWLADGSTAPPNDPIRGYLFADSDRQVAAKLVDLDPEQQMVSEIWGLEVRICDQGGTTLLRGRFEPAAFIDIWDRASGGGPGDNGAGAMYQSVLSNLEWGAIDDSPFLRQLRQSANDGLLSIKFNVDGINMDSQSKEFMRGRIVGTIGPAQADEPHHFVLGRQFMTTGLPSGNFFAPAGQLNFCVAVVNEELGKVYLDLGNALPCEAPGGPPKDLGALSLLCIVPGPNGSTIMPIGDISYTSPDWYKSSAGVTEVPANRRMTDQELQLLAENRLVLVLTPAGGNRALGIAEPPGGLFLRADQFVFRLNPGKVADVRLFATRWGQRYGGARIFSFYDPNMLQGPAGDPTTAIEFMPVAFTDTNGVVSLPILTTDPGTPRGYIDGQVYGVRSAIDETLTFGTNYPFNQWNFVSLLVWSGFQADEPPTWFGSMELIFKQYANLYPVMQQFLDMGNYADICANRELLLFAFGLDSSDPNVMPVTRDLSNAKRQAILRWLTEIGPDGNPLEGTPPPAVETAAVTPSAGEVEAAPSAMDIQLLRMGGKTAAMNRRLALRRNNVDLGVRQR